MTAKEKPVHGGNRERAEGKAALGGTSFSDTHFTTVDGDRQRGSIETILLQEGAIGRPNAVRTSKLVALAGLRDKRILQSKIEAERADGALIISKCSEGGGYYLPAGRAEVVTFERTLKRRALGTLRSLRAARKALEVMEGQAVIPMNTDGEVATDAEEESSPEL